MDVSEDEPSDFGMDFAHAGSLRQLLNELFVRSV